MTTPKLASIRVHIEQHHIDNAEVRNSHRCMIADAIREEIPGAKFISVDLQSIRFSIFDENRYREEGVGRRYHYFTPTIAQVALLKFDQGKKLRPLSFTMRSGICRNIPWPKKDKVKGRKRHISKGVRKHIVRKEREFGIRMFQESK